MSRILLTWELGENLGHFSAIIPLAYELRKRGHEPVLCLRDLSRVATLVKGAEFPLLQAPIWSETPSTTPPLTYAEILLSFGFNDAEALRSMFNAWRNLLLLTAPDLMIFDHSPTALLASRELPFPRALIGTGFFSPPRMSPFPPMRWWLQHSHQQIVESEASILSTVNIALIKHGMKPLNQLHEIFDVEEDFLCTYQEFDPYPQRDKNERYWGGKYLVGSGCDPIWYSGNAKRVFVYLDKNYNDLEKVLQTLAESSLRILVYAPSFPQQLVIRYQSENIIFATERINLGKLAGQCDVGICHANHGTTSALLMAGIPLLLLPIQLEHFLTAVNVQKMGAGLVVHPEAPAKDYATPLQRLLNEAEFTSQAQMFAAKYSEVSQQEQIELIADRCEELLAGHRL